MEELLDKAVLKELTEQANLNHVQLTDHTFMTEIRKKAMAELTKNGDIKLIHEEKLQQIRNELHVRSSIERLTAPQKSLLKEAYSKYAKEINLYEEITGTTGTPLSLNLSLNLDFNLRELSIITDLIANL
jgi:hypothetical protein